MNCFAKSSPGKGKERIRPDFQDQVFRPPGGSLPVCEKCSGKLINNYFFIKLGVYFINNLGYSEKHEDL